MTSQATATAERARTADCYSGGERAWMLRGQELRASALAPLLDRLQRCRVTPDHVTLASLAFGVAFCPLYFVSPPAALAALLLHVLLDGLDGPLARRLGTASRRGSFTDTLADQTVITATTITLVVSGHVGAVPGSLYIFLYALVVAFAMVRNALEVPYSWLFRPRFAVYTWAIVELAWWPGSLNVVVWASCLLLGAKAVSGFLRLRRSL